MVLFIPAVPKLDGKFLLITFLPYSYISLKIPTFAL